MGRNPNPVHLTYYLRPYLADYLRHRYGVITKPLPPNLRCEESPLLLFLNCTAGRHAPPRAHAEAFARGRIPYTIIITSRRAVDHGRHVPMKGLRNFERLVYQQFIHELAAHIAAHRRHGVQQIAVIMDFMLNNGINPYHIDAEDMRRVVSKNIERLREKRSGTVPAMAARTVPPSPPA